MVSLSFERVNKAAGYVASLFSYFLFIKTNRYLFLCATTGPEENCYPLGICQRANDRPHRPVEGPGSAGPFRGRKRDIFEGGHRVPGIVSWPAIVGTESESGFVSWETTMTDDFLPTIMDALGVNRPPEQSSWALDGRSILPILRGQKWSDTKYGERSFGIGFYDAKTTLNYGWGFRHGKWKYVEGSASCIGEEGAPCREPQLYDLSTDLGERNDLSKEFPIVLAAMQHRFKVWHEGVMASRKYESKCTKSKELTLPRSIEKMFSERVNK